MSHRWAERIVRPDGRMETYKQFEAFLIYRDLPPEKRTYREVARRLSKSPQLICKWGQMNDWENRAKEYDAWKEEQRLKQFEKERYEVRERVVKELRYLQSKCLQKIQNTDPEDMSLSLAIRGLLEAIDKEVELTGLKETLIRIQQENNQPDLKELYLQIRKSLEETKK